MLRLREQGVGHLATHLATSRAESWDALPPQRRQQLIDDPRFLAQSKPDFERMQDYWLFHSPEWMVARTIAALHELRTRRSPPPNAADSIAGVLIDWTGAVEQRLYGDSVCRWPPRHLTPLSYLWWRLERDFGITPIDHCFFSDQLLQSALAATRPLPRRTRKRT